MIFLQVKGSRLDCLMLEKGFWKGHQKSRWWWLWRSSLGCSAGLAGWNRCVELLVALSGRSDAYDRHRLLEGAVEDGVVPALLL